MAIAREARGSAREQLQQWKAKNQTKNGKMFPFRGTSVKTRGKKRTCRG